jgi:ABC-type branched-subunit amino acid transport system substrate-binding protein
MKHDDAGAWARRHWLVRGTLPLLAGGLLPWWPRRAAAQAVPGVTANQILIGQTLTLDGGRNDYGVAVRQGVEAATQRINAAGGVAGRQLVFKVMDDQNKADLAEANARQLASDGVFLLFGSIEGGPSTAVMKAAIDTKVPFFGPMAGAPTLRRPYQPLVFPVRAEHREEFRVLLTQARSLGMQRAAFLQSDSDVGRLHLANVQLIAKALGLSEAWPLVMTGEVTDARLDDFVRQLRERRIQVMFNHGSIGAYERLIRRARAAGLTTVFQAVNSGSTQLANHLGPLAHGMVFTQVVPSPWERKTALTREYQDAFSAAFTAQPFSYGSLEGYVTLMALAEALKRTGRALTRPALLKTLGDARLDIAGYKLQYRDDEHVGSTFVDTAIVTREGKFRH